MSDIPLVDTPECESLGFSDDVDNYRQFSGPAHLYAKQVISNELGAVNTAAYSLTLPELLFHTKRAWSGGISMVVYHGSPYSGNYPNTTWPGYTTFNYMFTDMWNRIQPCWQHMKDTLDYVGRTQFILQQGVPQIDLAFYLYETPYTPVHQYPSENLQILGMSALMVLRTKIFQADNMRRLYLRIPGTRELARSASSRQRWHPSTRWARL